MKVAKTDGKQMGKVRRNAKYKKSSQREDVPINSLYLGNENCGHQSRRRSGVKSEHRLKMMHAFNDCCDRLICYNTLCSCDWCKGSGNIQAISEESLVSRSHYYPGFFSIYFLRALTCNTQSCISTSATFLPKCSLDPEQWRCR